ncbi:hypothetical protein B0H10DRAFT_2439467 [Mycena sp. CBHHK59/15]|nr:hypothetical protein B0H10DRAFT_2439467 [Mycena sp. CBHHK59/15]
MGLLQVYLYFFWYSKDRWSIKATVIAIAVLETVQISTFFSAAWSWLIDGFGDFNNLRFFSWQALAQLAALYTSTFVAQTYFASCIYLLHKKNIILPAVIIILSLVGLGGGLAQVILAVKLKTFDQLPHTSAATNTQAALALVCDLLITVGLCWRLNSNRSGIQSTNKLLNFLITTAINRGVLTMITALMNMILFLTQPGTFYFMLSLLISGKLYMNSMLAMSETALDFFSPLLTFLHQAQHAPTRCRAARRHGGGPHLYAHDFKLSGQPCRNQRVGCPGNSRRS